MDEPGPSRHWGQSLPRRPAVPAAVLLILGIIIHSSLPHRPIIWLVMIVLLLIGTGVSIPWRWVPSICLMAAIFILGVVVAQIQHYYYPTNGISAYATDQPRLARLELRIDQPPRILTRFFDPYRPLPPKQVTTATVLRVLTWNGWVDCGGQILVQIEQPHPRLAVGQRVSVMGRLQRPGPAMNPGQFDWAQYYRDQRILTSLAIARPENIEILQTRPLSLLQKLRESTRQALAAGFSAERSLDHALLRALLLGDSDPELRDVQEQFRRTGTSHHLSISGLHVAILGGFVFLICRLLCCPPRASAWTMTLFVVFYGLIALPSPPVVRSVLLCASFGFGLVRRRSLDAIQLLAVSIFIMLIYHPLDLYNAGFQLSFGTVLGLMIFARPATAFLVGLENEHDQIGAMLQRRTKLSQMRLWTKRMIFQSLAAGGVAWIVSLPLIAYHFEQLNPWAIAASILLAPIVFAGLIGGLLKVILTLLWPSLAGAWAAMAIGPIALMRYGVDLLSQLPGSDVPFPSPSLWMIFLFYLLISLPLLPFHKLRLRWCLRCGPAAACVMAMLLPALAGLGVVNRSGDSPRLTLLAVGAGQCAILELGDKIILLDAGSTSLSDLLRKCLGPFLRHHGVRRIDSIYLSHANIDHFSAAAEVADAYDIREVLVGRYFQADAIGNPPAEDLLAALNRLQRRPHIIEVGQTIALDARTSVDVLWPPPDATFDANNSSLVLRITHRGRRILFTGDIQEAAQRKLLENPNQLRCDVLVAPHHGSSESTTADFIRAADPRIILSSNDRTLTKKQRDFEEIIGGRLLYRTHRHGAITLTIGPQGEWSVNTYLDPADSGEIDQARRIK